MVILFNLTITINQTKVDNSLMAISLKTASASDEDGGVIKNSKIYEQSCYILIEGEWSYVGEGNVCGSGSEYCKPNHCL